MRKSQVSLPPGGQVRVIWLGGERRVKFLVNSKTLNLVGWGQKVNEKKKSAVRDFQPYPESTPGKSVQIEAKPTNLP